MAAYPPAQDPSPTSSRTMKTTKRGRPYLKDILDLFATFILSLNLTSHKQFFRTFPHSFTTDEATINLASLQFSQSVRGSDPREPTRVMTTTTTTMFSMSREIAKAMCQHFMDMRLIENAADPSSNFFKDNRFYILMPKGLHVLEHFISKNGIGSDRLQPVFSSQPTCFNLLHLERRSIDDEIIVTQSVITALFRRFVGRSPNYPPSPHEPQDPFQRYNERSKGIALHDVVDQLQSEGQKIHKHCFSAVSVLEWLPEFTSIMDRGEAAEMAAQFVRYGLISLVSDKRKNNDSAIVFTVRGFAPGDNSPISKQGEFRCTKKAVYRISKEGRRVAHWDHSRPMGVANSPDTSSTTLAQDRTSVEGYAESGPEHKKTKPDAKIHRRISMAEKFNVTYEVGGRKNPKESNVDRLRHILADPGLCSVFREFLRNSFCEENLAKFWIDVEDFKKKFSITSSAMAVVSVSQTSGITPGQVAREKHHELLVNTAFIIYNTYLAPSSRCELSIDHGLRNELVKHLEEVVTSIPGKTFQGHLEPEQANAFNATQLQNAVRLYERIQVYAFRLMATDSIPKFIKTSKFLAMRNSSEDFNPTEIDIQLPTSGPVSPPLLIESEEVGGTYMTISQQAAVWEYRTYVASGVAPPSASGAISS